MSPLAEQTLVSPTPASAWAAAWLRARSQGWRHVWVVGALCVGIALLLTAIDGSGFGTKLVYSLAIGSICTLIVDGSRLLMAYGADRVRSARGLPLQPERYASGWHGLLPGMLLCVLAGPLLGLWLGDLITGNRSPSLLRLNSANTRITLVLSLLGTVFSVFAISTLERLAAAREQAQQAQRLAAENQLRLLQSQLEPHMLFNTLANLRVLIGLDPPQAQAMLDRLIAFLRATLNASRSSSQPLAAEFTQLADYLALMALRMGPRLQVRLDLPAALASLQVPPLLLQPLVENAIKHGLEPKIEGGRIDVSAQADGLMLQLTVRDSGVGLNQTAASGNLGAGSGFGLEQVRQRLATLYGSRASLQLQAVVADAEGGAAGGAAGVEAIIRMPLP